MPRYATPTRCVVSQARPRERVVTQPLGVPLTKRDLVLGAIEGVVFFALLVILPVVVLVLGAAQK